MSQENGDDGSPWRNSSTDTLDAEQGNGTQSFVSCEGRDATAADCDSCRPDVEQERERPRPQQQNEGKQANPILTEDEALDCFGVKLSGKSKFTIGILLLIGVDIIWVASSAATKYIFDEDNYPKPLFTLYFKTSLFALYLLGIPLIPSWRDLARRKFWRPVDLAQDEEEEEGNGDRPNSLDCVDSGGSRRDSLLSNSSGGSSEKVSPALEHGPNSIVFLPPILAEVEEDGTLSKGVDVVGMAASNSSPAIMDGIDGPVPSSSGSSIPTQRSISPIFTSPRHSEAAFVRRCQSSVSTTSVTSLKSCMKRSESATSIVDVPALPTQGRRPSLAQGRFSPMALRRVLEREETESEVVESRPDSGQVVKARRSSKVHFNVDREVRVLPNSEWRDANYARRSFEQAKELAAKAQRRASRMDLKDTAKLALFFVFVWFIANYFYQLAFVKTSVATVNILSSTSSLFVLVLGAFLSSDEVDRFNGSKLLIVLVCCAGVGMVGYSDSAAKATKSSKGVTVDMGVLYSLIGAFFYACYVVLLKRYVKDFNRLVVPLFFGFVGLWCLLLIWPFLLIFNYTGVEKFELPSHLHPNGSLNGSVNGSEYIWPVLAVNGVVGTVISETLWITGVFLTSALVGTLALVLVNPLSLLYSMVGKGVTIDGMYIGGSLLVTLAFILASLTSASGSDPVGKLLSKCWLIIQGMRSRRSSFTRFEGSPSGSLRSNGGR